MKYILSFLILFVATAHARPNYSGVYKGQMYYYINEGYGFDTAADNPEPFKFKIADKKTGMTITDVVVSTPMYVEIADSNGIIASQSGTYYYGDVKCEYYVGIQFTNIKKKSATGVYKETSSCINGSYLWIEGSAKFRRKR